MVLKIASLFFLVFFPFPDYSFAQEYYIIRVDIGDPENYSRLVELHLDFATEEIGRYVDVIADEETMEKISRHGYEYEVVKLLTTEFIPDYPSYDEIVFRLDSLSLLFPDITELIQIGESHEYGYPIYAIKVSDSAHVREDETVLWFDGVHHAREPMGMMTCMALLEHLLNNYGTDPEVTEMVDSLEIWIVPILNTEGYVYFIDVTTGSPWWRKNQHDNDMNGVFDFYFDGIDLNRNYNLNFYGSSAGSPDPWSWVYRGKEPFSEKETQAKRDMVQFLRPIAGISYHSYGEVIFYRIGANGAPIPETSIIEDLGIELASRIPRLSGSGTYESSPGYSNSPMSYPWMFVVNGTWEFLVELGTEHVPTYSSAEQVAQDNIDGALYVLERSLTGPGIRGHVTSSDDGSPVEAVVKIVEYWDFDLSPRKTEPTFGRFNRFADPGSYTLEIFARGYEIQTLDNVVVDSGWTEVEVNLTPSSAIGIVSAVIDDDDFGASRGNDDGLIGSGETIELDLTIKNFGARRSGGIDLILRVNNPKIWLIENTHSEPPIDPDSTMELQDVFVFEVAGTIPNEHPIKFSVGISDSLSMPWSESLDFIAYAPSIEIYSLAIEEIEGNNDGRIGPGETVGIDIEIINRGLTTADSIAGSLFEASPEISIIDGMALYGDLTYLQLAAASIQYVVKIDSGAQDNTAYYAGIEFASSNGYEIRMNLAIGLGEVAFVDNISELVPLWQVKGTTGQTWHRSGRRNHSQEQGRSWKSSGISLYEPRGNTLDDFLVSPAMNIGPDYMLGFWYLSNMDSDTYPEGARAGGQVLIYTQEGSELLSPIDGYTHTFADMPPIPAEPCYAGINGWMYAMFDLSDYEGQTVSIAYRFAAVPWTSDEGWFIDDIIVASAEIVSVDDTAERLPLTYRLSQNYPNPFNPMTSLEYQLPEAADVEIVIYNLLGQIVTTLVNATLPAGYHQVTWDASNVASGIYFYRLIAGDFIQTRKMVLLK